MDKIPIGEYRVNFFNEQGELITHIGAVPAISIMDAHKKADSWLNERNLPAASYTILRCVFDSAVEDGRL